MHSSVLERIRHDEQAAKAALTGLFVTSGVLFGSLLLLLVISASILFLT
jgi:hypothetical protein